jgi:hypothetical protein
MMSGYHPLQDAVIRAPLIGPALYRLNVAKPVIAAMYRRHVYADRNRITPEFLGQKTAVARLLVLPFRPLSSKIRPGLRCVQVRADASDFRRTHYQGSSCFMMPGFPAPFLFP